MVAPNETIGTGAPKKCEDCGTTLVPRVMFTCAYYIGTTCQCGPYSRESEYFKTREQADQALAPFSDPGFAKRLGLEETLSTLFVVHFFTVRV